MITGHDLVILTPGPVAGAISSFLDATSRKWGSLLFSQQSGEFHPWIGRVEDISDSSGDLLIAQDRQMADRWQEEGYFVDNQGGPFSILYQPMEKRELKVSSLEDPYSHNGFGFRPYEMLLLMHSAWLVTLVTPDEESPFSRDLMKSFTAEILRSTPSS
ncbi:hypothetical protein [Kitasatospora sp. NPDC056184]|uniref:hypothetical protein n=1 Tax=Kitasatospora sp. NPDC056184 TaxID=3345738 RepID=UPI0035D93159